MAYNRRDDAMWGVLNHEDPRFNQAGGQGAPPPQPPYGGQGGRGAAPSPPRPNAQYIHPPAYQRKGYDPKPATPPRLSPLDGAPNLPPAKDALHYDVPRARASELGPLPPGGRANGDLEERLAGMERMSGAIPILLQRIKALEKHTQSTEAAAMQQQAGAGARIQHLEGKVASLAAALDGSRDAAAEAHRRAEASAKAAAESRARVLHLEKMVSDEFRAQLVDAQARDQSSEAIREENRKRQTSMNEQLIMLTREVEQIRSESMRERSGMAVRLDQVAVQVSEDAKFMDRLRDVEAETVNATAEQFAKVKQRMVDLSGAVQDVHAQLREERAQRGEDRAALASAVKLVQGSVMEKVTDMVEERLSGVMKAVGQAQRGEGMKVGDQIRSLMEAEEGMQRTNNERLLALEEALRDEHGRRIKAEESIKRLIDLASHESAALLTDTRKVAEMRDAQIRQEVKDAMLRMRAFTRDMEEGLDQGRAALEEVVRMEIQARLSSVDQMKDQMELALQRCRQVALGGVDDLSSRVSEVQHKLGVLVGAQRKLYSRQAEAEGNMQQLDKAVRVGVQVAVSRLEDDLEAMAVTHLLGDELARVDQWEALAAAGGEAATQLQALEAANDRMLSQLAEGLRLVDDDVRSMQQAQVALKEELGAALGNQGAMATALQEHSEGLKASMAENVKRLELEMDSSAAERRLGEEVMRVEMQEQVDILSGVLTDTRAMAEEGAVQHRDVHRVVSSLRADQVQAGKASVALARELREVARRHQAGVAEVKILAQNGLREIDAVRQQIDASEIHRALAEEVIRAEISESADAIASEHRAAAEGSRAAAAEGAEASGRAMEALRAGVEGAKRAAEAAGAAAQEGLAREEEARGALAERVCSLEGDHSALATRVGGVEAEASRAAEITAELTSEVDAAAVAAASESAVLRAAADEAMAAARAAAAAADSARVGVREAKDSTAGVQAGTRDELLACISEVQASIAAVQGRVGGLQGDVEALDGQLAEVNQHHAEMAAELAALAAEGAVRDGALHAAADAAADDGRRAAASTDARLGAAVADLHASIAAVESRLAGVSGDAVEAVRKDVEALQAQAGDLGIAVEKVSAGLESAGRAAAAQGDDISAVRDEVSSLAAADILAAESIRAGLESEVPPVRPQSAIPSPRGAAPSEVEAALRSEIASVSAEVAAIAKRLEEAKEGLHAEVAAAAADARMNEEVLRTEMASLGAGGGRMDVAGPAGVTPVVPEARAWSRLLIISSRMLSPALLLDAARDDVGAILYDWGTTTLEELLSMAKAALGGNTVSSVALLSHGKPGAIGTVSGQRTHLDSVLRPEQEDEGRQLVAHLEKLTQTNFAASDDVTKASDFLLESDGVEAAPLYFDVSKLASWKGTAELHDEAANSGVPVDVLKVRKDLEALAAKVEGQAAEAETARAEGLEWRAGIEHAIEAVGGEGAEWRAGIDAAMEAVRGEVAEAAAASALGDEVLRSDFAAAAAAAPAASEGAAVEAAELAALSARVDAIAATAERAEPEAAAAGAEELALLSARVGAIEAAAEARQLEIREEIASHAAASTLAHEVLRTEAAGPPPAEVVAVTDALASLRERLASLEGGRVAAAEGGGEAAVAAVREAVGDLQARMELLAGEVSAQAAASAAEGEARASVDEGPRLATPPRPGSPMPPPEAVSLAKDAADALEARVAALEAAMSAAGATGAEWGQEMVGALEAAAAEAAGAPEWRAGIEDAMSSGAEWGREVVGALEAAAAEAAGAPEWRAGVDEAITAVRAEVASLAANASVDSISGAPVGEAVDFQEAGAVQDLQVALAAVRSAMEALEERVDHLQVAGEEAAADGMLGMLAHDATMAGEMGGAAAVLRGHVEVVRGELLAAVAAAEARSAPKGDVERLVVRFDELAASNASAAAAAAARTPPSSAAARTPPSSKGRARSAAAVSADMIAGAAEAASAASAVAGRVDKLEEGLAEISADLAVEKMTTSACLEEISAAVGEARGGNGGEVPEAVRAELEAVQADLEQRMVLVAEEFDHLKMAIEERLQHEAEGQEMARMHWTETQHLGMELEMQGMRAEVRRRVEEAVLGAAALVQSELDRMVSKDDVEGLSAEMTADRLANEVAFETISGGGGGGGAPPSAARGAGEEPLAAGAGAEAAVAKMRGEIDGMVRDLVERSESRMGTKLISLQGDLETMQAELGRAVEAAAAASAELVESSAEDVRGSVEALVKEQVDAAILSPGAASSAAGEVDIETIRLLQDNVSALQSRVDGVDAKVETAKAELRGEQGELAEDLRADLTTTADALRDDLLAELGSALEGERAMTDDHLAELRRKLARRSAPKDAGGGGGEGEGEGEGGEEGGDAEGEGDSPRDENEGLAALREELTAELHGTEAQLREEIEENLEALREAIDDVSGQLAAKSAADEEAMDSLTDEVHRMAGDLQIEAGERENLGEDLVARIDAAAAEASAARAEAAAAAAGRGGGGDGGSGGDGAGAAEVGALRVELAKGLEEERGAREAGLGALRAELAAEVQKEAAAREGAVSGVMEDVLGMVQGQVRQGLKQAAKQ